MESNISIINKYIGKCRKVVKIFISKNKIYKQTGTEIKLITQNIATTATKGMSEREMSWFYGLENDMPGRELLLLSKPIQRINYHGLTLKEVFKQIKPIVETYYFKGFLFDLMELYIILRNNYILSKSGVLMSKRNKVQMLNKNLLIELGIQESKFNKKSKIIYDTKAENKAKVVSWSSDCQGSYKTGDTIVFQPHAPRVKYRDKLEIINEASVLCVE